MFKKKIDLIKPIIYESSDPVIATNFYGKDNNLYRSLKNLFETFWIYNKKELYLVGGCVRDLLLDKDPKDYDLCTNATPDEVKEIIKAIGLKSFDSGIKHGTLTIIDDFYKQSYEITTYRIDGKYSDGRHPDEVEFTPSLEEDLKRRDFTVNSFAYNLLTNEITALDESYFNDLQYGIIRTVGDAAERFKEDALRMLRAIRFSAQLNFSIAKETYKAIEQNSVLIKNISKERIRDELTKIILSDNPQLIELFAITKLEEYAFKDYNDYKCISKMLWCEHENPWHYTDVFHHTIDVVKNVPKIFELRWAAFFHDIGKPEFKKPRPQGPEGHFVYYNHQIGSVAIADRIMTLLKFSNEQKDLIIKYIKYHNEDLATCKMSSFKKVLSDIGIDNFPNFIKLRYADSLAHKLINSTEYVIDAVDKVKERFIKAKDQEEALTIKDLDIDGYDLMDKGLKGKQIGECLEFLLDVVLEEPGVNYKEALLRLADVFMKRI